MTPVETIALITALLIILKSMLLLFFPKQILRFTEKALKKKLLLQILYILIGIIVAYFLLREITLIEFIATLFLTSVLIKFILVTYSQKSLLPFAKEAIQKKNIWIIFLLLLLAIITIISIIKNNSYSEVYI